MVIEISVALIAASLIATAIFLCVFLLKTGRSLDAAKRDLHTVSGEAVDLIHEIQALVSDLKSKSDSLDVVFRPLKSISKVKGRAELSDTAAEVAEWVSVSLALFGKIRNLVRRRER